MRRDIVAKCRIPYSSASSNTPVPSKESEDSLNSLSPFLFHEKSSLHLHHPVQVPSSSFSADQTSVSTGSLFQVRIGVNCVSISASSSPQVISSTRTPLRLDRQYTFPISPMTFLKIFPKLERKTISIRGTHLCIASNESIQPVSILLVSLSAEVCRLTQS